MCFLTQTILLLLLFRFLLLGALLKSLASLANCSADALGSLRFFRGGCYSIRSGAVMLGYFHHNMCRTLLVSKSTAHRRRTHTLPPRPFVHVTASHEQRVHIQRFARVFCFAFGIRDGAAQRFLDFLRHALLRKTQSVQRFFGAHTANQIDHQPRLLWRHADVSRFCHSL